MSWTHTLEIDGDTFEIQSNSFASGCDPGPRLLLSRQQIKQLGTDGIARVVAWFQEYGEEYAHLEETFEDPYHASPADFARIAYSPLATDEQKAVAHNMLSTWNQPKAASHPIPAKPRLKGTVYVLRTEDGSHRYKIGRTRNLIVRHAQLDTLVPYELTLCHAIPCLDPIALEQVLHTHFATQRVKGEWFELTDDDLQWIRDSYPTAA